jgi:hypothetical protein
MGGGAAGDVPEVGVGGAMGAGGPATGAIDAIRTPHWLQKRASSVFGAPQDGQYTRRR